MKIRFCFASALALCLGWSASSANFAQASVTSIFASGPLSASAEFDTSGTNLTVTLTNTSGFDVLVPADVLTAVFFDLAGNPALGSVSAVLAPGSIVLFDAAPAGGVVGGEWAYLSTLAGPGGASQGIGSAGFGLFGGPTFPGPNLDGPVAVNGMNYGILSAGDNPVTGNAAVTGSNPFIKNSVVFTLSGLPGGFALSGISNVWFQYGTALTGEPGGPGTPPSGGPPGDVPEPASFVIWSALAGMGAMIRRNRR